MGQEGYFAREKKQDKKGEEAFFKQGEKPEVRLNAACCLKNFQEDMEAKTRSDS